MVTGLETGMIVYTATELAKTDRDSILGRLIGPTVDYVGDGLKNFTEKQFHNYSRIINNASKILGSKLDSDGQVSARVWRHIIGEGVFCDDELTLSYFGGVLASSRNNNPIDDRSLTFASLLESLSSYQIRMHYILYTILRNKLTGVEIDYTENDWVQKNRVYIPYYEFENSMNIKLIDHSQKDIYLPHIFWGLKRLELISNFSYTNVNVISAHYPEADRPGFVITPSLFGIELYMWANGHSDVPPFKFLDENIQFVNRALVDMPPGAVVFGNELL